MTLKEYEEWVDKENIDKYYDKITYDLVALAGEVGEVQSEWKSAARGRVSNKDYEENMLLEFGDVLHYLIRLGHDFGYTLEDIAAANFTKLENRKKYGKGGKGKWS